MALKLSRTTSRSLMAVAVASAFASAAGLLLAWPVQGGTLIAVLGLAGAGVLYGEMDGRDRTIVDRVLLAIFGLAGPILLAIGAWFLNAELMSGAAVANIELFGGALGPIDGKGLMVTGSIVLITFSMVYAMHRVDERRNARFAAIDNPPAPQSTNIA